MASSNNQEVDVLDNWEDIEESDVSAKQSKVAPWGPRPFVLERKFSNLKPPSQTPKCNGSTNGAPFKIILTGDDALRSQYVPPEPTVTILKRPSKQNRNLNENRVIQPKKTLKQREQEYAEARLRILGEAPSPEKPEDPTPTTPTTTTTATTTTTIRGDQRFTSIQNKPRQLDENVIRMPKGPDGTKGFDRR